MSNNVKSSKVKKTNKNFIAAYFTPFGLRQICDLLMLAGAIVIIVGLSIENLTVITVGIGIYIAASLIAIIRSVRVFLAKDLNRRSPEYRNALINVIIMSVILIVAVLAILAIYLKWGVVI
jgi:hypothetical protein